jgi:hypothetical protein
MKRVSLLMLAIIALAFTGTAQVKFGAKAGVNLANLTGKILGEKESYDTKTGLHIGGFVEIPISEKFSVAPEVNFDQWGAQTEELGTKMQMNLNYINVPILAKVNVGGFGIYAGPQIGILMSAKAKSGDLESDEKESFNSIDYGAVFGAEYNLAYGIFLSARYNLGLSRIDKESDDDNYTKNTAITFGVGIKFGGSSRNANKD